VPSVVAWARHLVHDITFEVSLRTVRSPHPQNLRPTRHWVVALIAFSSVTCAHDSTKNTAPATPAAITVVKGDAQQGIVGQPLSDSLVVLVVDADGQPLAGQKVTFRLVLQEPGAAVAPEVVTTDAHGRAGAGGMLGSVTGLWQVQVEVAGGAGRILTARVTALSLPDSPDSISVKSGQDQGGRVSTQLSDSLVVEVVDRFGNLEPGVEVSWGVVGGGSASAATTVTGADGRTGVTRTLGETAGDQSTTATVEGLKGSPVSFHHLAVAAGTAGLFPISGGGQTGGVSAPLPNPLKVRALDGYGNAIVGQTVTWSIVSGGGSVTPASSATDASGTASANWTLGPNLGSQTITAKAGTLPNVTFQATAIAGPPAEVAMVTQPAGSAQSGAVLSRQPKVRLKDAGDNPTNTDGVPITVALASGPAGTLSGTLVVNTNDGQASFTDLAISGPVGSYTLRFTSPGLTGVTSAAVVLSAGAPATLAITTQPSSSAIDGEPFARQPVIELRDAADNLVNGVQVDVSVQSGGGILSGTTSIATVSGKATFTDLAIGGASGAHTLLFSAQSLSAVSNSIDVTVPPENSSGEWSNVFAWPMVAVHLQLLPNGKVLSWGKYGTPSVWDPSSGNFTSVPSPALLFCAGHSFLPDGRLLVTGGHISNDHGLPAATVFHYETNSWSAEKPMSWGRWYPTSTTLPNGEALQLAGADEDGNAVTTPEVWLTGGGWRKLTGAVLGLPYYPRAFVAPNGKVFVAGPSATSRYLNTSGSGSWSTVTSSASYRDYGSAAMYAPGKIIIMGGGGSDSSSSPRATAEVIDLNQASPSWRSVQSMHYARRHLNATLLPTGEVLVTGGTSGAGFNNPSGAVHAAEVWNPTTEEWTTLASNSVIRIYHSTSLLLPDGRVLHAGSGDGGGSPSEDNAEIFSPPYLFKGPRPVITSAPSSVGYGEDFSVSTPNGASIAKVSLIRLGSVTHAFDANERFNQLTFSENSGGLSVHSPSDPNLAPPGHYLLFPVNANGVPSVAKIIRIQ
jgi:hypothetical protein